MTIRFAEPRPQPNLGQVAGRTMARPTFDSSYSGMSVRANGGPAGAPPLPGLSADDFADLAARRRAATAAFENAQIARDRDAGRAEQNAALSLSDLAAQFTNQRNSLMANLGDRGLATSPRAAGKGLRNLLGQEARARADVQADLASRLAALDAMVSQTRAARDSEYDLLTAEEVRRRSDLGRLLTGLGA